MARIASEGEVKGGGWTAVMSRGTDLSVLSHALVAFWRHNAMGMAGMIAFFGFLSLIPSILLLLALIGHITVGPVSSYTIGHLFHDFVPGLSNRQFLNVYWRPVEHSRFASTVLGVVSLLLGTLGLHDAVDWSVNRLWLSPSGRAFWIGKLRGLGVILWISAFAVFNLWLAWLWAVVLGVAGRHSPVGVGWAGLIPSLLVDVGVFTALYKLTPTVEVQLRPALLAGILATTLWEASKVLFGWWVLEVASYNSVYGPLAASVIVMLWLWMSAMIFLYGAQLSAIIQQRYPRPARE